MLISNPEVPITSVGDFVQLAKSKPEFFSFSSGGNGDAAIMFPNVPNAEQLVSEGKLKGLTVTSARRLQSMPAVPTMMELGFSDFEVVGWYGIVAPAGTPEPIVKRLNATLQAIIDDPSIKEILRKNGFEPMGGSAAEFAQFNRAEINKWRKAVQAQVRG
jgi:tripartite-type tricarboxylate transporter receptor subunit TctC